MRKLTLAIVMLALSPMTASAQRIVPATVPKAAPSTGCVMEARVAPMDVIDGSTIVFTSKRRVHIKLIGIQAPKVTGRGKAAGLRSRNALRKMIKDSRGRVTIFVPSQYGELYRDFGDAHVYGFIWANSDRETSLNQRMLKGGWAMESKP